MCFTAYLESFVHKRVRQALVHASSLPTEERIRCASYFGIPRENFAGVLKFPFIHKAVHPG